MKAFLICILACIIGYVVSPSNCKRGCTNTCFSPPTKTKYSICRCSCPELDAKCAGCLEAKTCKSIDTKCQKYEQIKKKFNEKKEYYGIVDEVPEEPEDPDDE